MEWLEATIEIDGFFMVLGSGNHWFQWLTMVIHHWSNDGILFDILLIVLILSILHTLGKPH